MLFLSVVGKIAKLVLVGTLFCPDQLRRKWSCHKEVWAGCIQEFIQAKLPSFPSQLIPLIF